MMNLTAMHQPPTLRPHHNAQGSTTGQPPVSTAYVGRHITVHTRKLAVRCRKTLDSTSLHQHGSESATQPGCMRSRPMVDGDSTFEQRDVRAGVAAAAALASFVTSISAGAAQAAAAIAEPGPGSVPGSFTPGPVHIGWEVYAGAIAGVVPFAIGAYEFGKRILDVILGMLLCNLTSGLDMLQLIQRRCATCSGSGLVMRGRFQRKCPDCGGFFPWRGWGEFLSATASPGNGGPLRAPRGQTSVFYKVPSKTPVKQGKGIAETERDSKAGTDSQDI